MKSQFPIYNTNIKLCHFQQELSTKPSRAISLPNNGVSDILIEPSTKLLVAAGWDFRIRTFSTKKMEPAQILLWHRETIMSIDTSSGRELNQEYSKVDGDGLLPDLVLDRWNKRPRWLVVGSQDSRISLWNLE